MEVMDALPLATTDYPGNQPLATSRRGIQGRQRRQVNVRPREDDEASSGPAARSGNQNAPRGDGSGASTAPRFVPMMYVPGKARQESGAASPAGPAYSGRPASSGGAAAGRYGAQPDSGRYGAQPGSAESMLNTTRGLFKLRPRRNIRVKSVDALEDDAPLPPRADDEDAPSYSTGFLRDAPATGSLARRERTNVRDMLCARSQVHQPSLGAPALGAPPLGAPTLGGPTPGAPTPYPALGAPDPLAGPDQQSDLHMLQPVADLYAQYSHHNPHAGHAHQGSEPAQQRPLVFEDNRPFFLDDEPLPLPGESVPQEMDRPDMEQFENGEHEALENPATDPLFSPEQLPPGIDPYGSMMQPPHETMELPGGSVDPYLGGMSHPQGLIAKPFQTPTESYEDRIAALKARMQQSSMVPTNPQEETLDQRKQRILGKLYEQKFGPPAGSEPTGYESLEEKKARIFENLRRKHNLNTDQLLGVGDSRARAPVAYGRSLSMGDTLDDREDLLLSEYGSGPTPDGSVIPGSQPIPRFEYRPTTAPPSDFRPVVDEEEAPIERQDAQRDVVRSDIPVKAGSQSSVKSRSQSPVRSGSQSPVKSGSQSPVKSGSQSPVKSGSQSPVKSGSQSPVKSGSQSPVKSGSQSPVKSGSQSPVKSGSQSPVKSGSQSPVKLSSQSPVKSGSQSPVKSGPPRRQLFELETPAQHQSQAPTEEDEDRETRTSAFVKLRPVKPSRPSSSGEASNQGSFQIRAGSGGKSFLDRPEGLERSNSSGIQGQGSSRSQGESPSDDVISVDSGFHDKMANEAKPAPKSAKSSPEPEDKRRGSTSSSASGSSKADSAVLPPKSPGVARRNYLKPWAVSATADKPATAAIPKKAGPPTKPKPGAAAPAPQQRAKSTPPSRSKSTTNLVDVGLSIPERRERSASLYKDGDSIPEPAPFSRNSRVRSSTKAWEQRQAEAKAKLAAQQSKQPPKTAPKTAPKPVKKPAGPSSAIVGKVTLSADSSNEDKPSHSPRKVTNYDKPWRMGAKSRQSSPHRTGTPSSSSGASSRAQSPAPRPRTTSTSRAQSPAPRPRTTSGSHSPSRRGSQDLLEHGGVLRPPKNPVKGQGSAGIEGGPRSPEREEENRPVVNELDGAQQTTTTNTDGNKRAKGSAMSAEEYSSLLDLAADWLFGGEQPPVLDVAPVHGANGPPNGANDVGYHEHMDTNIENEIESGIPTKLQLSNGEPLTSIGFEDSEAMTSLPEDCPSVGRADINDTDFARPVGIPKGSKRYTGPPSGTLQAKRTGGAAKTGATNKPVAPVTSSASIKRKKPTSASGQRSGAAGALDEDSFIRAFEDVPKVYIYSGRELTDKMNKVKDTLSDTSNDWEKRVDALKELRSLMVAGALDYDEFLPCLRTLEPCVITSVKDLRSQVVRESSITVSYLSQQLSNKFDHFAEAVFPHLFNLVPNSAKIMSTSGSVCIRFIVQHTHATRLIPIITGTTTSKSGVVRKESFELLDHLLHTWPTHTLERHIAVLQEAIKKGITDADSEARSHSRKAFWGFHDHFQDQADSLLSSLDPSKQKMLQGELSNSSSSNSLSSGGVQSRLPAGAKVNKSRSRSMSSERTSQQLYSRTLGGSSNAPRRGPKSTSGEDHSTDGNGFSSTSSNGIQRSSSAMDLAGGGRGGSSIPRAAAKSATNSNYNSLRFRNMRQMKAFKRKGSTDSGAAYDENSTAPSGRAIQNRPRTLSASDLTLPSSLRPTRSSADLLSPDTRPPSGSGRAPRPARASLLPPNTPSRPKKKPIAANNLVSPERSRPRSRIGVSQSQPGSRSGSPSSRLSYITHTQPGSTLSAGAGRTKPKSSIPRSQGASRETSPTRTHYGRERRLSGSTKSRTPASRVTANNGTGLLSQHLLTQGNDVEQALSDALTRGGPRRRYESYDSDDNASETSSVCSERSLSSYSKTSEASDLGERRSSLRMSKLSRSREDVPHSPFSQDMSDIIANLSSGSWADRKEGLIGLQNLLRGNRLLNRLELKKITEIFTRMFHDPHGKVFSVFMETLIELVAAHRADLHDWLYICLTRLLNKMGADLLGSVQARVQRALEAVRDSFPYDHQFQLLNRFIVDQTQTPNLKQFKVKVALLNYLHGLALLMDPSEFTNSSDTRLAVSRIITWTTEPKSVDVRKAAQAVLIALFNLNSPEFSMMLSVLPKTFQDGATRILHNHLRSSSQDAGAASEPLSPRNLTSPTYGQRYRPSPNRAAKIEDMDTENMNPEDIYNSIKKTSADIQNLSKLDGSHYEAGGPTEGVKKERDSTSQDSGIQGSLHDLRGNSPDVKDGVSHGRGARQYNPAFYQDDSLNGYNKAALAEAVFDVDNDLLNDGFNEDLAGEQADIVGEILKELSNHNQRCEQRTNAMLALIKLTRDGAPEVWDEHFKTILLLLLETLGDADGHIRALALRVLREILRNQPGRFKEYAELTILKILEAHRDPAKEVSRAAEECATTLAHSIPADQCLRVLKPIIQTAEYPVNLAAIKMETKVVEKADKDLVSRSLAEIIPGLLKAYDNRESPVRKASVFCLVALYIAVEDELKPYVDHLSGSKLKLLNLYIKRSLAERGQSGSGLGSTETSKTTSPASTVTDFGL